MRLLCRQGENGEGERVTAEYVKRGARSHAGHLGARRAARVVEGITRQELDEVIEHWADSALGLNSLQLRLMQKLAGAQTRLKPTVEFIGLASPVGTPQLGLPTRDYATRS